MSQFIASIKEGDRGKGEQWCLAVSPISLRALYSRFYSLSPVFCMKKTWGMRILNGCMESLEHLLPPRISGVDGALPWGWVALVWPSFLRARKTLWRFHLLKDIGLTWYLWDIVSHLDPCPLAFHHLGRAVKSHKCCYTEDIKLLMCGLL